ncbi:MAG: photosystem II cytochrome c-550 [Cyanobacteria bacterium P01_C01_bin.70]
MLNLFKNKMIKYFVFPLCICMIAITFWAGTAMAVSIDKVTRTIPLNAGGRQTTLTTKQLAVGQRKFNGSCAQCHLDGTTKTNPSVDLGPDSLTLATPPRNTVESIVDYLEYPTTYDGLRDIAELHPSTQRTDLFPKMRDLTKEDLTAIAGYILLQPKIVGDQWAGGKPKR